MNKRPICLITGVGPEYGTGAETAKCFSKEGYFVAMIARSKSNLLTLEKKYPFTKAFPCDVSDTGEFLKTIKQIQKEVGHPEVVIHNAPMASRGNILTLDPNDLERNFKVNVTALLHLAQQTLPQMQEWGRGAIMVTGNTAATRGKSGWGFFASTKAGQRILAESIAREFGPKGIHVSYFVIDAAIDNPRTRANLYPDKPDEFFANPRAIAKEILHTVKQDKSAWSFNVELRPFGEVW
ncbi:MAG: short-chain dehydrogenase [Rhodospirillaceae bacterium TMED8]|nr:short-chain dehydrogenase [Magnetovibrio sp.]OUT51471.1 MAG: short-chain dehydrogenase [Rhodospirillaceae bacterium TMED8]